TVHGPRRRDEGLAQRIERGALVVLAVHVAQQARKACHHRLLRRRHEGLQALAHARRELRGVPALARDPDHRHAQETAAHELIERRVDLAIAQIAGGPEQYHGITVTAFHGFPRRDLRTRGASPTGPCWRTRPARVTRSAHTVPRSAPGRARR